MKKHSYFSLVATILAVCVLLCSCADANKFPEHIEAGKYSEAINDYSNYIQGTIDKELEAKSFLEEYLSDNLSKFSSDEIAEIDMKAVLECVQKVDDEFGIITSTLADTRDAFNAILSSRESYNGAVAALDEGDFESAITKFESVCEQDSLNYENAQKDLETARTAYKGELLGKVQTAIDSKEYEKAISLGEEGLKALGNSDAEMQQLIDAAILGKASDLIDGYISEENYEMVIRTYNDFATKNQALVTAELTEKVDKCKQTFFNVIVEKSKEAYFVHGPEAAMSEVKSGQTVLKENSKLDNLYNLYLSSVPVSYSELRFNTDYDDREEINNGATDSFGELHTGKLIKMLAYYRTNALIGYPNYKYNKLKASLFMDCDYKKEASATVEIEGDGRPLYKSDTISRGTKPFEIDIDISGIDEVAVKITPSGTYWDYIWIEDLEFSNPLSENDIELAIQ